MKQLFGAVKNWITRLRETLIVKAKALRSNLSNTTTPSAFAKKLDRLIISVDNYESAGKVEILNEINAHGVIFADIGIEDGRRGLRPSSVENITANHALRWQSYLKNIFEALKKAEEIHLKGIEKRIEELKSDIESSLRHKNIIDRHYEWSYKSFAKTLGWFYLGVALFLIIADIPLSLQLTAQGFELPFVLKEGFNSFNNLQALALTIGIALFTVYIKIFYDEYFSSSIEKQIMQYRRKEVPWVDEGDENAQKNKQRMRSVWYLRLAFKISILIIIIFTIKSLGEIRYNAFMDAKHYQEMINNADSNDTETQKDSTQTNTIQTTTGSDTTQNNTFILLTIIFPLIGGVCMSLGLDMIQNNRLKKKVDTEYNSLINKNIDLNGELEVSTKNVEKYDGIIKWCNPDDFVKEYSLYFRSCYVHGFENGVLEAGVKDLFSHAGTIRNQHLMNPNYLDN